MTVTLSVGEGVLTVTEGDSGVTLTSGNSTSSVTFIGTLGQLNNLLTGAGTGTLIYQNGSDAPSASTTITLTVNDNGNSGVDPGLTADGLSEEDSVTQTIVINPINDAPTVLLSNLVSILPENTDTSTSLRVADIQVVDDGTGVNQLTLSGADAANFEIVGNELRLRAGAALDAEVQQNFDVVVQVDDATVGSTPDDSVSFSLTITDVNEFDVSVPVDIDATANRVAEDAMFGDGVGLQVFAQDFDVTNNNVVYSLVDSGGGRFALDSSTGVVTVIGGLDYEQAVSHDITVRAISIDGSFATATFTIQIDDVNEFGISSLTDTNAMANTVFENSAIGTSVGITAFSSDGDGFDLIAYTLDDDAGGRFAVDSITGVVTIAGGVDRESFASHDITVRATSTDGSTVTQTYTISIGDVDEFDVGPIIDTNATPNLVVENSSSGVTVGISAYATDGDSTQNTIVYSLIDDDGGRFVIDAISGVISSTQTFDFELDGPVRQVRVLATSADGSSAAQNFTISIVDVNEQPDIVLLNQVTTLPESVDTTTRIKVADIQILDDALGTNQLSLTGTNAGDFEIDGNELYLRSGTVLDYESVSQLTVQVSLDDITIAGGPEDIATLSLDILDVNDNQPVIDSGQIFQVDENSGALTSVGSVLGSDGDVGDVLSGWNIVAGNESGQFSIDPVTGELLVAVGAELNYESTSTYSLMVTVSDGTLTAAMESIVVQINDVNDRPEANNDVIVSESLDVISIETSDILLNDFDEDGDALSIVLVTPPETGTLTLQVDGSFSFTPDGGFFGVERFSYLVTDGLLDSEVATVEVLIEPLVPVEPSLEDYDPEETENEEDTGSTEEDKKENDTIVEELMVPPAGDSESPVQELPVDSQDIVELDSQSRKAEPLGNFVPGDKDGENQNRNRELTYFEVSFDRNVRIADLRSNSYRINSISEAPLSLESRETNSLENGVDQRLQLETVIVSSTAVTTATLSVGYILWMFRGGALLASFMTTLPAWTQFDPLTIVMDSEFEDDSESLIDIADHKSSAGSLS